MSSEERVVRPYLGVDRLQHVLDGVVVSAGKDAIEAGGRLDLSSLEYLTRPVALGFAGEGVPLDEVRGALAAAIAEIGIAAEDAELLALVSTNRLKVSEIVWRLPVSEIDALGEVVIIADAEQRPTALRTPFGGSRIDLFVLLRRSRDPEPLRPWRKGTWLARTSFEIVTDVGEIGFTPLPLDDTIREKYGLPSTTNRFVRVESVLDEEVGPDDVELYVDPALLAQLAQSPGLPAAKAFQRQLFLDAAQAIVIQAVRSPELAQKSVQEIERTLVGKLVAVAAGRAAGETAAQRHARQDSVLTILRSDPNRFVAWLDAEVGDKGDLTDALKGAQS